LKAFQSVNGIRQTGVLTATGARYLGLTGKSSTSPSGITSGAGYAVFGEYGDRVRSLQQALVRAGIPLVGGVDGSFGGGTASAIMEFQRRNGLPVTGKVDSRTAAKLGLRAQAPPPAPSAVGVRLDHFPVQRPCWFGDTWLAPRGDGRTHQGVDIIAAEGTRLYAGFSGMISKIYVDQPGSRAGNGLRISRSDETYITYLHLKRLARGISVGSWVDAGQLVGRVGNTGNSATPHLHFEIHPRGGAAVNPYPIVKAMNGC
jgi:murein DD-endopeptidase MepM/ murein hydrolase activator NlpD